MKQRFSSLDVRAISHELHHQLAGTRLNNVYDLVPPSSSSSSSAATSRTILLRFSRNQDKFQLIVDSGFRCHLTAYDARASAAGSGPGSGGSGGGSFAPSAFVSRLRTLLNGRHVTAVAQVGTDRIIEIRFSDGQLRLYLEFFAAGNIVLTDADAKVLAVQRTVAAFRSASLDVTLSVGSPYAIATKQNVASVPLLTLERLREVLEKAAAADGPEKGPIAAAESGQAPSVPAAAAKKRKNRGLSRTLALAFTDLPQVLVDHALLQASFDTVHKAEPADIIADSARLEALFRVLQDARKLAESLTREGPNCRGYIIATKKEPKETEVAGEIPPVIAEKASGEAMPESANGNNASAFKVELDYVDFHPFRPSQFESDPKYAILAFDSFNKAADEFYSHLQGLKADRQVHQRESVASKKLEATKRDQAMRIESLQETQQMNSRKAAAIEANQDWVQAAIDAVNEQLREGTDWEDLALLIENSASSNPVAALIKLPMRLADHTITLRLSEEPGDGWDEDDDEDDEEYSKGTNGRQDEEDDKTIDVDVKLTLSAWSNAREYYDQKRVAAIKEAKTKEVTSLALRNAERKVAEELKRAQKSGRPTPQLIRRQLWFEKFLWFVSSDGYLVLAAKESQQCEMLYRRYFRTGDVYVHADIRGSPGIIVVKNHPDAEPDAPIPPATLSQAGCLAVCASEAWDTKAGLGAYWVRANQVFKSTVSGELLPLGVFDIRGEKNHLPPPQRVLGFGLLFRISDDSKGNHSNHHGTLEGSAKDGVHDDKDHEKVESPQVEDREGVESEADEQEMDRRLEEEGVLEDAPPLGKDVQPSDGEVGDESGIHATQEEEDNHEESDIGNEDEKAAQERGDEESDDSAPTQAAWKGKGKEHIRASSPAPSRVSTTTTSAGGAASKRGQKGKAKKLAKYKDQDEEDRARAERLIGIAAGREKAEAKARAKAQREAEIAAYEERRRAQREKQLHAMREFEAKRQAQLAAEGWDSSAGANRDAPITDAGGSEGAEADGDGRLEVLSTLVGRPVPGDDIVEVVPVCGPWAALTRLKYKVKMQPGQTKKGRAMRDVLERWRRAGEAGRTNSNIVDEESRDPERMWPREVELIAGLKMEEAANCVPVGKLTLMLAGGLGGAGGGAGGGGGGGKGGGGGGKGGGKGSSGKQSGQGSGKKAGGSGGGRGGKKK